MHILKVFKSTLYYSIFSVSLFLVACKTSEEITTSQSASTEVSQELENALLWKITGNELSSPSYLYGTIHLITGEDYFLPEGTLGAFDQSKNIVFEIDMSLMSDLSSQMAMLKDIFMKDNLTLKDLLDEEKYSLVSNHFSKMGMPMFMLERMKPLFLSVFASGDLDLGGLQSGTMKSYEMEFYEMASLTNKPVAGLETVEYQLSMFDSIPYSVQADILVQAIQSSDEGSDQFRMMIDMYKSQDITGMIKMISDEDSGMKGYEDLLVDQRNKNWISVMDEMMKDGPVFFAVGAGHLAGDNGVIKLLRKAGYDVIAVKQASDIPKIF